MNELVKKAIVSPAGDDPLSYVMSDETVDRMGDVIEADGWNLKNFIKNPIALFNHDSSFVIGHWTDVKVQAGKLVGKLNLLSAGISERLDEIRAAVEAGVLRAVSVGFIPDPDEMEPNKTGGWRFKAAELMECSLVSVPANPNALQMAKSLKLSDAAQRLIFDDTETELPTKSSAPAATGTKGRVVKLGSTARDRAKPFVIREIKRTA